MKKIFLGMVVVYFVMMTTAAYGFSEADVKKLKDTKQCPKCDLTKANLSGANLSNTYLIGANLTGANLNGANLQGASLYGANLSGAKLYRANLSVADLYLANLDSTDLSGVDLSGARLYGQKLRGRNLYRAKLQGANLTKVDLSNADLSNADLSNADLSNADLSNAKLYGVNLDKANLTGANLKGADLRNVELSGATWTDGKKCKVGSVGKCTKGWDGVIRPGKMKNGVAFVTINENGAGGLGHIGGAFQFEDGAGERRFMCFATENKGGKPTEKSEDKGFWYQVVDDETGVLQLFESKKYTAYKKLLVNYDVDPANAFNKMISNSKLDYNVTNRNCQNDVYDVLHDEGSGYGITADASNKIYIGWVQFPPTPRLWFKDAIGASAMGSL